MIKGKKAFMYSVVAIAIVFLVLNLFLIESDFMKDSFEPGKTKLLGDQLHRFEQNIEKDLEKNIDVVARRAMVSAIDYAISGEHDVGDAVQVLTELMMNGTIYEEPMFLMENNTLEHWAERINLLGGELGFQASLNYTHIDIGLSDSFTMFFNVNVTIKVSDELTNSSQVRKIIKSIEVPLQGFEDPLFPKNSFGRVRKLILGSPYEEYGIKIATGTQSHDTARATTVVLPSSDLSAIQSVNSKNTKILVTDNASLVGVSTLNQFAGFVSEIVFTTESTSSYLMGVENTLTTVPDGVILYLDEITRSLWDLSNLEDIITYAYYVPSDTGPSFLDRIEGKLYNTKEFGLESFVNLIEFENAYIIINDTRSIIDYEYFNNTGPIGSNVRGGYYEWICMSETIDGSQTHAEKYGVEELI